MKFHAKFNENEYLISRRKGSKTKTPSNRRDSLTADSSPVVFMLRDARGTGARGVIAKGDGIITPGAPVPRASRNMKTTGDESALTVCLVKSF